MEKGSDPEVQLSGFDELKEGRRHARSQPCRSLAGRRLELYTIVRPRTPPT